MYEDDDIHVHDCAIKTIGLVTENVVRTIQNLINRENQRIKDEAEEIGLTGVTMIRIKIYAYEEALAAVREALA